MRTFLLVYTLYLGDKTLNGKMRIKNCQNELHAKLRLDGYLTKIHGQNRLVIHSCSPDLGIFKDIFGW